MKKNIISISLMIMFFIFFCLLITESNAQSFDFIWNIARGQNDTNSIELGENSFLISFSQYPIEDSNNKIWTYVVGFEDDQHNYIDNGDILIESNTITLSSSNIPDNAKYFFLMGNEAPANITQVSSLTQAINNITITYEITNNNYIDNFNDYIRFTYNNINYKVPKPNNLNDNTDIKDILPQYTILQNFSNNIILIAPYNSNIEGDLSLRRNTNDNAFQLYNGNTKIFFQLFMYNSNTNTFDYLRNDNQVTAKNLIIANTIFKLKYYNFQGEQTLYTTETNIVPSISTSVEDVQNLTFDYLTISNIGLYKNNLIEGHQYTMSVLIRDNKGQNKLIPIKEGQIINTNDLRDNQIFDNIYSFFANQIAYYYTPTLDTETMSIYFVFWDLNSNEDSIIYLMQNYTMNITPLTLSNWVDQGENLKQEVNNLLTSNSFINNLTKNAPNVQDNTNIDNLFEILRSNLTTDNIEPLQLSLFGQDFVIDSSFTNNYPTAIKEIASLIIYGLISLFIIKDIRKKITKIKEGNIENIGHDIKTEVL